MPRNPSRQPGTATASSVARLAPTRPLSHLMLILALMAALLVAPSALEATAATAAPVGLFGDDQTPRTAAWPDSKAIELGVRFQPSAAGHVVGVRFYKGAGNSGRHTGSLWSSSGQRLATATFTGESASGWQSVTFAVPVAVSEGATYVASYHAPRGNYAADANGFAAPLTRGMLAAPAGAGVFRYGTSGFPTSSYRATNYWVDVQFLPAPGTAGTVTSAPVPAPAPTPDAGASPAPAPAPAAPAVAATNCASKPSACGYPDADTTGVPAGTALRAVPGDVSSGPGWRFDSRGWVSVFGDGAVLDGLDIPFNVDILASGVVVKNSRVRLGGESFGISLRHTRDVTIQDSEITGPDAGAGRLLVGIKDIYGDSTGLKVLRNDISRTSTGVQVESGLVEGNFIHDLGYKSGDHVNGTTSNGGTTLLTLRRNTVFNSYQQTDAISLFQDFGEQANRVIDNNLLAGGGYTLYAGANPGRAATSNIKVTNNRFSRLYHPAGGFYGPATAYNPSGAGNMWSGNVWDDTNAPVNP